jgi:hypothetical protein
LQVACNLVHLVDVLDQTRARPPALAEHIANPHVLFERVAVSQKPFEHTRIEAQRFIRGRQCLARTAIK